MNTRTYSWETPAIPADIMTVSSLELLRRAMDQGSTAPICRTLGFDLIHVEPGVAVFEGETGEHLYNPMGTVHGGYFATLLDSALGSAVMTRLPVGKIYTTVQLNVNMIRPAFAHTGKLRAEARTIHFGRTTATAEATLLGLEDGKLYAHGTTTCSIISLDG